VAPGRRSAPGEAGAPGEAVRRDPSPRHVVGREAGVSELGRLQRDGARAGVAQHDVGLHSQSAINVHQIGGEMRLLRGQVQREHALWRVLEHALPPLGQQTGSPETESSGE
jgi:hypothetical protein